MGLEATRHIGRIVIHPRTRMWCMWQRWDNLWGANPERGVYKTADGGKTWSQVLKINDDTGWRERHRDGPGESGHFVCQQRTSRRRRTPYGFNGGGPDSALYKTTGRRDLEEADQGLPYENGGETGRMRTGHLRKDPNIVYALVQHEKGGIYRSEDKGETWTEMSDTNPRPSYYSQVRIDPKQ